MSDNSTNGKDFPRHETSGGYKLPSYKQCIRSSRTSEPTTIILKKKRSLRCVLEGFLITYISLFICGYYNIELTQYYSYIPQITVKLLSSAISATVATCFLAWRLKYIPKMVTDKRELFSTILVGIIALYVFIYLALHWFEKYNSNVQLILHTYSFYFKLNVFLFIFCIPFIEEVLFRGYFLEMLRRPWGTSFSICFSSLLFIFGHKGFLSLLMYGDIHYLIPFSYVFLGSILFSIGYLRAGLLASIFLHSFANFFVLYINIGT